MWVFLYVLFSLPLIKGEWVVKDGGQISEGKGIHQKGASARKTQVRQQGKKRFGVYQKLVFKRKRRKTHIHQRGFKVFVGDPFAEYWCRNFGLLRFVLKVCVCVCVCVCVFFCLLSLSLYIYISLSLSLSLSVHVASITLLLVTLAPLPLEPCCQSSQLLRSSQRRFKTGAASL